MQMRFIYALLQVPYAGELSMAQIFGWSCSVVRIDKADYKIDKIDKAEWQISPTFFLSRNYILIKVK